MRLSLGGRLGLAVLGAVLLGGNAVAHAASLPAGTTAILSGAPSLLDAFPAAVSASAIGPAAVSQDGRFVAFASRSDGLDAGDDDTVTNVYVKDRVTGELTLVGRATGPDGEPTHAGCRQASISDNGLRVAFTCEDALDAGDTNTNSDIYVRDLPSATTILVSRASALGAVGDADSRDPVLSATGEFVAFGSDAQNLTSPSANRGVYRRQIGGGDETVLISRQSAGDGGAPAGGGSPSISNDGNRVAFVSDSASLSTIDTNGEDDVYVRNHAGADTALASRAPGAGAVGDGTSFQPALGGDGSTVAFSSRAKNFDTTNDPTDDGFDIYWRRLNGLLANQNTALVSINAGGTKGRASFAPSIDDDGNVVGFTSRATGLDPDDTGEPADAYVKNLMTNVLEVASRADGDTGAVANREAQAVAVSGDGTKVAVGLENAIAPDAEPSQSTVMLRDLSAVPKRTTTVSRPAGAEPFVNEGGPAGNVTLSADGRFAAFGTRAPALLPPGVVEGIVVRDRVTGTTTFASRADGPDGAPFTGAVFDASISADGRRVSFSAAETLDADASRNSVWVRDLVEGRTFLGSRGDTGAEANGDAFTSVLDGDGSRVVFASRATNMADGDIDDQLDLHLRDLETGRTILVSRGDGMLGPKSNGFSFDADISADGTRVSFVSSATNLGDGDTDSSSDAHLRDIAAGTTQLVGAEPGGVKSDGDTGATSIDAAGTRVAFASTATNLAGAATNARKVFVRDFAAGTLVVASRADGPDGDLPNGGSYRPILSPDGRYVAFESDGDNLGTTVPDGSLQVYRRDLEAGRTELVSRATGADGTPSDGFAVSGDVSRGGSCVAFESDAPLAGARSDFQQVFLRAFDADCGDPPPTGPDAPGPGGGGGPGGPLVDGLPDLLAPVLSDVRLTRKRFRVGPEPTALTAQVRRGTVLTFDSSEAATLTIVLQRRRPGRRVTVGGRRRCRATRVRPRRRACVVHRTVGTLRRRVSAGAGRIALSGRIGRKRMKAGRHRLTLVATDTAGNRSRTVRRRFRIVRG